MYICLSSKVLFLLAVASIVWCSSAEPETQQKDHHRSKNSRNRGNHRRGPAVQAHAIPEIWRWCKDPPSVFKDVEVLFENYPLVPGTSFNVLIRGDALVPLDDVTVKSKITVGGLFSMMDVQHLCNGEARKCPYSPGPQEQKLTCTFPRIVLFPKFLILTRHMYSGTTPVACIKLGPLRMKAAGKGKKTLEPVTSTVPP
ncbi:hypothetical protein Esti_003907 [Eimeria stiedai]